jgi:hypothetical protein
MFEKALRNARVQAWFMELFVAVAIKFTKEHLVDHPEEPLDTATALSLAWCRKDKPNLEIDGPLFNALRGEIRPIVRIKNFWNVINMPMRMRIPSYSLAKSESRSH